MHVWLGSHTAIVHQTIYSLSYQSSQTSRLML